MYYTMREELDHGESFPHRKFHRMLELIKRIRKDAGVESFDYEQAVVKLARFLSNISDWSTWSDEELFHYFEGHHKDDLARACKFIQEYDKMPSRVSHTNSWVVRDTMNHTDNEGVGSAVGFSRKTAYEQQFGEWPVRNYESYLNRVDVELDLGNRPEKMDEKFIKKLSSNEYFGMLLGRKQANSRKVNGDE